MITRIVAGALVLSLVPACATITRGTHQTYAINSEPGEAQVQLSTGQTCMTPCKLKLRRKDSFTAVFLKEGFEEQAVEVTSKVDGGGMAATTAGNFLFGGVIGAGVDATNGSLRSLYPKDLVVTMVPVQPVPLDAAVEPVAIDTGVSTNVETDAQEETNGYTPIS